MGIKQIPCIAQAVIDLHEAGRRLKEQHAQAKFEQCQQVLDLSASMMNITPPTSPLPTLQS